MKVDYSKLFKKMKEEHIMKKDLLQYGIGSSTMGKLRNNEPVTLTTICSICDYFHCMPDEIMEFIPDSDYEAKAKEKQELETQIAELQAKLKKL